MCRLLRQDTSFLRGHLPERMDIGEVADSAACRHYGRYSGSSTMVMRYQEEVTGQARAQAAYRPAAHLSAVPERKRRQTLARLPLGCSWVADDVGRTQRLTRDQRPCQHCGASLREFPREEDSAMAGEAGGAARRRALALAAFTGACRRTGRRAAGLPTT